MCCILGEVYPFLGHVASELVLRQYPYQAIPAFSWTSHLWVMRNVRRLVDLIEMVLFLCLLGHKGCTVVGYYVTWDHRLPLCFWLRLSEGGNKIEK